MEERHHRIFQQLALVLLIAILAGWLGVEGLYEFFSLNYRTNPKEEAYNMYNFLGLLKFVFLTPVAVVLSGVYSLHTYNFRSHYPTFVISVLSMLLFVAAVLSVLSVNIGDALKLVDCMYVFCVGDSAIAPAPKDKMLTGKSVAGTVLFFTTVLFCLLLSYLLARAVWGVLVRCIGCKASPKDLESEHLEPLLQPPDNLIRSPNMLTRTWRPLLCQLAVFLLLLPFLFFLGGILPKDWRSFSPWLIKKMASTDVTFVELDHAFMTTLNWVWIEGTLVVNLYPPLFIFYGFIYCISLVGFASQASDRVHRWLHHRVRLPTPKPGGKHKMVPVGLIILLGIFIVSLGLWVVYWGHDHKFHKDYTTLERAARTVGCGCNYLLSLSLLPCSRHSIWTAVFGVPWEHQLRAHTTLGKAFFVACLVHMLLWWWVYYVNGVFPHDILAVPMYYPLDGRSVDEGKLGNDFTIPLITVIVLCACVLMWALATKHMRNHHFELFYYSHHFALVLVLGALWHASYLWAFLLPGVALYLVDRVLRFRNATDEVRVVGASVHGEIVRLELQRGGGGGGGVSVWVWRRAGGGGRDWGGGSGGFRPPPLCSCFG